MLSPHWARQLCLSLVIILPLGCANLGEHRIPRQPDNSWHAKGKLGVVAPGNTQAVNFEWHQAPQRFDIRLFGALGIGSAHIEGRPSGVTLRSRKGEASAPTADELLEATLGWPLPVSALRDWIVGRESPAYPIDSQQRNDVGQLTQLQQAGWTLRFSRHLDLQPDALPTRIRGQNGDLRFTLVIKEWRS